MNSRFITSRSGHRFTGVIENFVDPNQMASSKAISSESIYSVIKKGYTSRTNV